MPLLVLSAGSGEGGRSAATPRCSRLHNRHMHRHGAPQALQTGSGSRLSPLGTTAGKEEQEEGGRQRQPLPVIPFYGLK